MVSLWSAEAEGQDRGEDSSHDHRRIRVFVCFVCALPAPYQCQRCATARYCGFEHQRADWHRHQRECSPPCILRMDQGAVTDRRLAPGDVVLSEPPLVCAPLNDAASGPASICLACFAPLDIECAGDAVFCACGFVFCRDAECIQRRHHSHGGGEAHRVECALLQPYTQRLSEGAWRTEDVWVIRALALRASDRPCWSRLLRLDHSGVFPSARLPSSPPASSSQVALAELLREEATEALRTTGLRPDELEETLAELYSVHRNNRIDFQHWSCVFATVSNVAYGRTPNVVVDIRQELRQSDGVHKGIVAEVSVVAILVAGDALIRSRAEGLEVMPDIDPDHGGVP